MTGDTMDAATDGIGVVFHSENITGIGDFALAIHPVSSCSHA